MKKKYLLLSVFLITHFINSQNTITSSGGTASNAVGTTTFTIGQVFYTTNSQNTGSITQGVQQPFEFEVLSTSEVPSNVLILRVYPNPTSENLMLKISDVLGLQMEYALFDIQGKLVFKGIIANSKTQIKVNDIANGIYVLKIIKGKQILKNLKVIKK